MVMQVQQCLSSNHKASDYNSSLTLASYIRVYVFLCTKIIKALKKRKEKKKFSIFSIYPPMFILSVIHMLMIPLKIFVSAKKCCSISMIIFNRAWTFYFLQFSYINDSIFNVTSNPTLLSM